MSCPKGYSDISAYVRLVSLPIAPWDYDGSPCRETYNGNLESLWNEFVVTTSGCATAPGQPSCVLSSCIVARYAAYVTAFNAAGTAYINCSNTEA